MHRSRGLLGVSFVRLEDRAIELFREIEKRRQEKEREGRLKTRAKGRHVAEGSRKLKRLISIVNYDVPKKGDRKGERSQHAH